MIAFISISISVFAIAISWMVVCSNRAFAQRQDLIEWVFDAEEPDARYGRLIWFMSVTFDEHTNALMCLRDPFTLYGERPA